MQTTITEQTPQALAEQLDSMARAHDFDREAVQVLTTAREQLRAISWARYKARHEQSDRIAVMLRRHKGRRRALEARIHA